MLRAWGSQEVYDVAHLQLGMKTELEGARMDAEKPIKPRGCCSQVNHQSLSFFKQSLLSQCNLLQVIKHFMHLFI